MAVHGELVVVDDVPGEFAERVDRGVPRPPQRRLLARAVGRQTARRCYERLADDAGTQIDWWKVDVYWGDERCVPLDHEDSNYRLGREALLDRVGAVNANYPMRCEEGPTPTSCALGELGKLDLVHLGLGADGHTASLFPGSPALDADPGRLVVMNEDPYGANPHPRMTLTFAGIARARLASSRWRAREGRGAGPRRRGRDPGPHPRRARRLAGRPGRRGAWLTDSGSRLLVLVRNSATRPETSGAQMKLPTSRFGDDATVRRSTPPSTPSWVTPRMKTARTAPRGCR